MKSTNDNCTKLLLCNKIEVALRTLIVKLIKIVAKVLRCVHTLFKNGHMELN
jgi:hypothetical protein